MRFWDIESGRWVTHDELADALRPLLGQPAPADVAALDARAQRAELQLADARQEIEALREQLEMTGRGNFVRWLYEARNDAAALRARLDDASAEVSDLRTRLDEALADRDKARAELAAMTTDRDEWREERQSMARRLGRVELALTEGLERD